MVYCLTCTPTGKKYVGSTKNLMVRVRQHQARPCKAMASDMAEFPFKTHWTVVTLCTTPTDWQAHKAEECFTQMYRADQPAHGYNTLVGHPGKDKNRRIWWWKKRAS